MHDPPAAPTKSLPPLVAVASATAPPQSPFSPLSPQSLSSSRSSTSYLSPVSTTSIASPRSPISGLFGVARKVSSAALRAAHHALEHQEHESSGQSQSGEALESGLLDRLKSGITVKDAIVAVSDAIAHPQAMDDRKMLLEDVITLLYSLPPGANVGGSLEKTLIRLLWDDLQHPPISFLGEAKYRSADGSGNNFHHPQLGAAGQPYARSVAPNRSMPQQLPDTATVWDTLMKRDRFVPHPSGISSLLFAFATCITHSCFNTNRANPSINDASSYLDLSPLYGNNQKEQDQVRTFQDGKLFDDVVASQRLFLMPPSTCALMVIFSRNHNWIVDTLVQVNQNNKYKPFASLSDEQKKAQDNDLFQTARLVNCGWFLQIIFGDYIRTILNVNQTESTWTLIPTNDIPNVARGTGNAVSIEFNLLYRWHACVGEKDTRHIEELMRRYSHTPFDQMTQAEFARVFRGIAVEMGPNPRKWEFGGLKRTGKDGTGRFSDHELVRILTEATEEVAGAFKARGVPEAMRIIDIMGMDMARNEWACATLNEFRSFLKLAKYQSFEEWNPDPVIANAAREIYQDINNLELVPGLSAEEPKPSQNGSGLAPGYTISRAILSDAVALVRGDRHFSVDYNPANLTSFLFEDHQPDPENGAYGGMLGKLLMRTFPAHYTYNSTYALFPFSTPSTTNGVLQRLKLIDRYDTRRPGLAQNWIVVDKRTMALRILSPDVPSSSHFEPVYGAPLNVTSRQQPSFLSRITSVQSNRSCQAARQEIIDKAFFPPQFASLLVSTIAPQAKKLIAESSWSSGTGPMRVDIVQRVIIPVCMGWISDQLGFPLKTKDNPRGLLTGEELYHTLSEAYTYVHLNWDATQGFKLRETVAKKCAVLRTVIDFRLAEAHGTSTKLHDLASDIKSILLGDQSGQGIVMSNNACKLYDRVLSSTTRPLEEIADALQLSMINFVSAVMAAAKSIDFFLRPENAKALEHLHSQTIVDAGLSNDSTVQSYVNEALCLDPAVGGTVRQARSTIHLPAATTKNGRNAVEIIKSGTLVYIDWTLVNRDESAFVRPNEIKLDRDPTLYKLADPGIRSSRDESINSLVSTAICRQVFQLSNVRRAFGPAGQLGGGAVAPMLKGPFRTVKRYIVMMKDDHDKSSTSSLSFFPKSMVVVHDGRAEFEPLGEETGEEQVWQLLD